MDEGRRKRLEEFCRQWDETAERKLNEGRVLPRKEIFERMAWELSRVPYEDVFVDVGCIERVIDFNVATGVDGFRFSCAIYEEVWDDEHDTCFTAVMRNHETLSVNIINLEVFVEKVLEIIGDLKDLKEKYESGDLDLQEEYMKLTDIEQ